MADELPDWGLFTEKAGNDVAAMFAILIGAMIAAGGGLGGGGVFVPIYILILQYPPKLAAALSQATIFGGSLVNLAMNLRKHHPLRKHRSIMDLSTLLIFEPMLLVGTIVGVMFNVMFPDIFILILLALVLSYATVRTLRKGIRLWKKESAEFKREKASSTANDHDNDAENPNLQSMEMQSVPSSPNQHISEESQSSQDHDINTNGHASKAIDIDPIPENKVPNNVDEAAQTNGHQHDGPNATNPDADDIDRERVDDVHIQETPVSDEVISTGALTDSNEIARLSEGCGVDAVHITSDKIEQCHEFIEHESEIKKPMLFIFVVWIAVSMFAFFRRVSPQCGAAYWVMTFLPFPIMMAVSYYMTKREYQYYHVKVDSGCWQPAVGDIKLEGSLAKIMKYPAIASIAGMLGGLLGIGGGMIVSPLLIELGVIPTVAAATSAMAVLITSSSATLQFLLLGMLKWDYTIFFFFVGIIGTYLGQTGVNYAVKEYGRVSVVVFAVAIIMGLAIILMISNGIINLADGVSWAFSPAC